MKKWSHTTERWHPIAKDGMLPKSLAGETVILGCAGYALKLFDYFPTTPRPSASPYTHYMRACPPWEIKREKRMAALSK